MKESKIETLAKRSWDEIDEALEKMVKETITAIAVAKEKGEEKEKIELKGVSIVNVSIGKIEIN